MATYDRQFEILHPTLDRLSPVNLEVADTGLLDPTSTSPVPLVDGELVQHDANYQYVRGVTANNAQPSFFMIEWRGDFGVQASRKVAAIKHGGFEADTLIFDSTVTTLGAALELATITEAVFGGVARAALRAQTTGVTLGRLRFIQTLV
jgi:hypothetical protein